MTANLDNRTIAELIRLGYIAPDDPPGTEDALRGEGREAMSTWRDVADTWVHHGDARGVIAQARIEMDGDFAIRNLRAMLAEAFTPILDWLARVLVTR